MGNKFEATVRRAAIGMALIKGTGFLTASIQSKRLQCRANAPRRTASSPGLLRLYLHPPAPMPYE